MVEHLRNPSCLIIGQILDGFCFAPPIHELRRYGRFGSLLRDAAHARSDVGVFITQTRRTKNEDAIIALSAAVLVAAAPAAFARNASNEAPHQHHQVSNSARTPCRYLQLRFVACDARQRREDGLSGSYAPSAPKDYTYDSSRNSEGGGGM